MGKNFTERGITFTENHQLSILSHSIMFLMIGIGIYVRMKGIGKWPLTVDEYYIAKSVKNILAYGLPKFECGGYYVRGILYQYIAAPFLFFFSNDELYLRIIPAFFNILAILPIYWLGKRLCGAIGGCAAVVFFSLSLWEIEFARFARMYAPFQAIFIWYVFFLYRAIVEHDNQSKNWMYILSSICLFIYEGSIFLAVLNFIPFIYKNRSIRWTDFFISLAILLITVSYLQIDFRHLGVTNYLPSDLSDSFRNKGLILLPLLLLGTMSSNSVWIFLFGIPLCISAILSYKITKLNDLDSIAKTLLCILILLSLLNLFGFVIAVSLILFLLGIVEFRTPDKLASKWVLLAIFSNFIFWIFYGLVTEEWHMFFGNVQHFHLKKFFVILFKYPNVFEQILYPWIRTIPILTIMGGSVICFGIIESISKQVKERSGYRFLSLIAIILCLSVGLVKSPYHETRYTFFLYPIIILLMTESMIRLAKLIAGNTKKANVVIGFFILTCLVFFEDFSIYHMKRIDSKEVNFRMNLNLPKVRHYYGRRDYKTPALIINENIGNGNIVVSSLTPPDYYLNQLDYSYINWKEDRFSIRSCFAGTKDLWSNSKLIYKEEALWDIVDNHPSIVWLIAASDKAKPSSQISRKISEKYHKYIFGSSIDGMINVYKIIGKRKL